MYSLTSRNLSSWNLKRVGLLPSGHLSVVCFAQWVIAPVTQVTSIRGHLRLQLAECFPLLFFNDPLKEPGRAAPSDTPVAVFLVFLPVSDILAQGRV